MTALDLKLPKPFAHAVSGGVVEMRRLFVKRLQESGVNSDRTGWFEDPKDFG